MLSCNVKSARPSTYCTVLYCTVLYCTVLVAAVDVLHYTLQQKKQHGEKPGVVHDAPPEEAPCCLQHLPDSIQLALHILELKQVAEDELVLSHGLLADHNAQWPINLQAPARRSALLMIAM